MTSLPEPPPGDDIPRPTQARANYLKERVHGLDPDPPNFGIGGGGSGTVWDTGTTWDDGTTNWDQEI